jgi:hypothetical protein
MPGDIRAKAMMIYQSFVWLAYGHSFASENEDAQAMAANFMASYLKKGYEVEILFEIQLTHNVMHRCHLPLFYIPRMNHLFHAGNKKIKN